MTAQPGLSVLVVCQSYPPVVGGTEIEVQRVSAALRRRGHKIEVICAGGPPMPAAGHWTDEYGTPVRIVGDSPRPRMRDLQYALGVAWTLIRRRREYDVAYFLMPGLHLALGLPAARAAGKPIVMKFSGSNEVRKLLGSALGRLELSFLRRWASRILVLNPAMEEEAREARLPLERLGWMPNPVDTDEFSPLTSDAERRALRGRLKLPANAHIVLFVGRLAPEKQLASLLRAFVRVAAEDAAALLVLVGDGPERGALERQVEAAGLGPRVVFAGRVPVAVVRDYMQAADVFTLVSSLEGLPCSLIEAMAVGLPSVVSDIAANRQLIEDGVNGYVAPVGDDEAIGAAMVRLLRDGTTAVRFGRTAREQAAARYSTVQTAEAYERLFAEVLAT